MRLATVAMLLSVLKAARPAASFSTYQPRNLVVARRKFEPSSLLSTSSQSRHSRLFSSSDDTTKESSSPEPMANIYTGWSLDDDRLLLENRRKPLSELASILGRGLRGVESRLEKLTDVNSQAYERLFVGQKDSNSDDNEKDDDENSESSTRLVPAKEVLRRIQWDYSLSESDFSVLHYDRVEDIIVESPMTAPNMSVKGKETLLVLAIPEHRIEGIRYKEQIVWDKENRIDRVFGSMGGKGTTIQNVIADYDEWKARKDAAEEWNRQRQAEVSSKIQAFLGEERFDALKQLSSNLLQVCQDDDGGSPKRHVEMYVQAALQLFRDTRQEAAECPEELAEAVTASSDYDSLDIFSELVALLPDSGLRPAILTEIAVQMNKLIGRKGTPSPSDGDDESNTGNNGIAMLPELDENDLVETFVKGSGAGGQKVNKTANKVVLLHEPTQLRVECQDTRSLQQNRKIARKRLRLKLDEFLNGSQSKIGVKNKKAASKKAKAKTRSKARLKKKKSSTESDSTD